MKKLSIKDIITFRSKSERAKKKFAAEINMDTEKSETEGGGDYWISSLSAISNGFKVNNVKPIKDKIYDLEGKYEATGFRRTKIMYKRNIDILYNYEDVDFNSLRPSKKLRLVKKHRTGSIISVKGLDVKVNPTHVFTFGKEDASEIGAIWFIAKLEGYTRDELGMFTDALHRYLKDNFSDEYSVSSKYCISVDVVQNIVVNYSQIQAKEVAAILNKTIEEIKGLM